MIEYTLPWPMYWGGWDKCGRVREAVAAKFIDLELDPVLFSRVSNSVTIFRELAEIAAKSRAGRYYLERVCKAIRDKPEDFMQARTHILRKLI